jgi:hypothetical protein
MVPAAFTITVFKYRNKIGRIVVIVTGDLNDDYIKIPT